MHWCTPGGSASVWPAGGTQLERWPAHGASSTISDDFVDASPSLKAVGSDAPLVSRHPLELHDGGGSSDGPMPLEVLPRKSATGRLEGAIIPDDREHTSRVDFMGASASLSSELVVEEGAEHEEV